MNDKQRKAMFAKAHNKQLDKEYNAEKAWENKQSPEWHKEKKLQQDASWKAHQASTNELYRKFNQYEASHKNERITVPPLSSKDKAIVLKYVEVELKDPYKDYDSTSSMQDLINAKQKIINNDYSFTIKEANAIHGVADVQGMMLNDNPDLNDSQRDEIGHALGGVDMWDQRHKFITGFIKYKDEDDERKQNRNNHDTFVGFDKYKRMTYKGGNEPVWDSFGGHLKTGDSIHAYAKNTPLTRKIALNRQSYEVADGGERHKILSDLGLSQSEIYAQADGLPFWKMDKALQDKILNRKRKQ
jgi:hypothetical protein